MQRKIITAASAAGWLALTAVVLYAAEPSRASNGVPSVPLPTATTALSGYQIHPDDVLQVTVYEEPDLSTKARVTSKGEISLPLLGPIQAAGLSVTQLEQKITQLLQVDYLVNPQVTVFLESAQQIFVTGAVNRPGAYPFSNEHEMTAMEAVAMAGGFSPSAALNRTRIMRKMPDGQQQVIHVKAKTIMHGDTSVDVPLKPGDILFVPEGFF